MSYTYSKWSQIPENIKSTNIENEYLEYATVCYLFSLCISKWYCICYIEKSDQRQSDIMKHVKKDRSSLFHYVTTKKISFLLWTLKIKGQAWSNYFETVLPSSFSLQFRGFQIKKSLVPLIFLLSIRKGH